LAKSRTALILLLFFSALPIFSIDINTGWEFRWGDSPFNKDGEPLWTFEEMGAWNPIDFPSNPPDREAHRNVWYRVRLPEAEIRDPTLFIYSIDTLAELYLEREKIYQFGEFDGPEARKYRGWPWHIIPLDTSYSGKILYIRVYSDYTDIGLWGEIKLDSRASHIEMMIKRDFVRIIVALVCLFLSAVSLILFFYSQKDRSFLYLFLLTFAQGLMVFGYTHTKQLFLNTPLLWEYLRVFSFYFIPAGITLLLESILGKSFSTLFRLCRFAVLAFAAGAFIFSITGIISIANSYPVFNVIFIASLVLFFVPTLVLSIRGERNAKLILLFLFILTPFTLFNSFASSGIIPWFDEINYIIMALFSAGLSVILINRLIQMSKKLEQNTLQLQEKSSELEKLNNHLEKKVVMRTRELEESNKTLLMEQNMLREESITDNLSGLYNSRYIFNCLKEEVLTAKKVQSALTVVLVDINHLQHFNDTFGSDFGDEIIKMVSESIFEDLRLSDLAGRYSGDKFLVILPGAEKKIGSEVGKRISRKIADHHWRDSKKIDVTLSYGCAEFGGGDHTTLLYGAQIELATFKKLVESGGNPLDI
jgi:diguanylate cyclase